MRMIFPSSRFRKSVTPNYPFLLTSLVNDWFALASLLVIVNTTLYRYQVEPRHFACEQTSLRFKKFPLLNPTC